MARDSAVGLAFKGKDEVTPVVRGIRSTMDRFKRDAATGFGLGAGISVFNLGVRAIGGLVDMMGDAVRSAAEEEAQIAQLTQAIKENDQAWDGNVDALEAVIRERQRLAFSDGEQRESLRGLVSVTGDLSKALDIQRTAMDLARLKGMDLGTATELLGKVYAGNLGTLSRYGIVLKKGATATEALAEIQRRATGQAETFAESNAGKGVRAQIAMQDAMEDLGKAMTPIVATLASTAAEVIPAITDAVGDLGTAIGDVIDPAGTEIELLDAALRSMAEDLGLSEAAVLGFARAQREARAAAADAAAAEQALRVEVELYRSSLMGGLGPAVEDIEGKVAAFEASLRGVTTATDEVNGVTGEQARIMGEAASILQEFNAYVAAGGDVTRWLASGAHSAAGAIEETGDEADDATDELRKLTDGLDLARGAFKDFWKGVRAEQRQIRFFITHPGKLREETDHITAQLEALEAKKAAIEKYGVQRRERLALLAIDRLIAKLRGKQDEYRALGVLYGNASESGMESAFDPDLIAEIRQRRLPSRRDILTDDGDPGRAHGGPVTPHQTYVVGERGPEVLTMGSQGGYVTPNHQLGSGSGPIYLVVDGAVLARSVDRRMGDAWALTRAGDHYRSS